jgi:hypothetical protein
MYTRTFWIDSIIIFFFKKSFFRVFKRSNILFKKHYFQKGSVFIFYRQKNFFWGGNESGDGAEKEVKNASLFCQ